MNHLCRNAATNYRSFISLVPVNDDVPRRVISYRVRLQNFSATVGRTGRYSSSGISKISSSIEIFQATEYNIYKYVSSN